MFSGCVVGLANGVAAGWASVGSGVTQLVMPLTYTLFTANLKIPSSIAWRLAFIVPAIFQAITALMVLVFGQDLPDGNYSGKRASSGSVIHIRACSKPQQKESSCWSVLYNGLKNYRGWILGLTYGFCFGVELTTDNIIAQYFNDRFNVNVQTAGAIAGSFGLANLVSRPAGGVVSDEMGRRFGMRGRLWSLWVVQTAAGFMCVLLGRVGTLWASILVICGFSLFVQAASGLTFGVVPFVSKRSLGVMSGMTASGGTIGAVVTQLLLFSGTHDDISTQTGISLMGLMMLVCTLPVTLIYFPRWGGMFCGPSRKPPDSTDENYHLLR